MKEIFCTSRCKIIVLLLITVVSLPTFSEQINSQIISDDPFGIYSNPASISFVRYPVVSFLHHVYLNDMSRESLSFVYPFRSFTFGISPTYYNIKPGYDYNSIWNSEESQFRYTGMVLPFTISYLLNNFSIGTTIKHYQDQVNDYAREVTSIDFGSILSLSRFRFGISGLNLVGKIDYYEIPRTIKSGIAYVHNNITVSTDYNKELLDTDDSLSIGSKIFVAKSLFFTSSYKFGEEFNELDGGFGLRLDDYAIDYAVTSCKDQGNIHRAGVSVIFGPLQK